MNKLPEKLTKLRKFYSYSQSYIADLLGIDALAYMNYENGKVLPRFEELEILAKFYKIDLSTLFINDRPLRLDDEKRYDIDKENYLYLQKMAKKERRERFMAKNKKKIILGVCALVILVLIVFLIPKKESLYLTTKSDQKYLIDASDTTVVYIDRNGVLKGTGDNTNSQLDFDFTDVISVVEGNNFTIALKRDGTILQAGLISRLAQEVTSLEDIVKIAAGKNHIVALDSKGHVTCIGSDIQGQCAIDGKSNIKDIFADGNMSISVASDGKIESYGDFIGKDAMELSSISDLAVSDSITAILSEDGHITYYSNGQTFKEVSNFTDIIDIEVGEDFICALDAMGKVHIDISENDILKEEVESWENVIAIASGADYLVALIDDEIVGVGNNDYGQFEVEESQKMTLASVSNVKVSYTDKDLVISFDKVANATSYNLKIDVGMGIAITATENKFNIPLARFEDGEKYTISIIAKGNDRYEDSAASIINFLFTDPTNTDDEKMITLDRLTGKTVIELITYLEDLGVSSDHILESQSDIVCTGDEPIVIAIEGISDYETLTLQDLLDRDITYHVCRYDEDKEVDDGQDIPDQGPSE